MAVSIGGGASAWFAGSSRAPFAAGVDRALPASLGRVHPRWGSPYVALMMHAILSAGLISFTLVGSSVPEAYQILLKAAVVIQLVPFAYVFAALWRLRDVRWLARAAGGLGFATSAFGMMAAFIPTADVDSVPIFELKMLLGCVVPTAIGLAFFFRSRRAACLSLRAKRPPVMASEATPSPQDCFVASNAHAPRHDNIASSR